MSAVVDQHLLRHASPEVARVAARLTGSADDMALRLREVVRLGMLDHERGVEMDALKLRLAADFGAARGWRLAKRFEPSELARRGKPGNWRINHFADWPREFTDHPTFYRDRDRRAVAVVGQPYPDPNGADAQRIGAQTWAADNELEAAFPTDYPSWWYPGWTILVLFEPVSSLLRPAQTGSLSTQTDASPYLHFHQQRNAT